MFGEETASMSWSDFFGGDKPVSMPSPGPTQTDTGSDDVVRTATTAASTRNVSELQAQIKRNGGVLTVGPNSSEYLVAVNNRLRFQVTRNASGQFEIRESSYYMYAVGGALLLGVILLAKK